MLQTLPQHLCPSNSNGPARVTQRGSAVPSGAQSHPAPGKTHTTFDFCNRSWEYLLKRKPVGDWLYEHISEACATATCMSHCHDRGGGDTGLRSVALEKSVTPLAAEVGGKVMLCLGYCCSWGSFIFSAVHSYGQAHRLSLSHVLVLTLQLHRKEVMRLSLTSEFSFLPRYHILFLI